MSGKKLERSSRFRFVDFLMVVVFISIAAVFIFVLADDLLQTVNSQEIGLLDLSAMKAPPVMDIQTEVPQISSAPAAEKPLFKEPLVEEPQPVEEPIPVPQASPTPAAAPSSRNMQPASGANFSLEELRSGKNITFSWTAVQGANAYIFYLYRQIASGQPQIVRTNLVYTPNYTIANSGMLDRGTFIWKIEAVYVGSGNAIERSGMQGESTFTVNTN
jgi:hypothetical protein